MYPQGALFMSFSKALFTIALLSTVSVWSQNVKVAVSLNPAGDFVAESKSVVGKATEDDKGTIEATDIKLDVKTLKTGIGLRDEHMVNKYLEAAKHPEIVMKLARGNNSKGQALLVIKGKQNKVSGTYEKVSTDKLKVSFELKLSDFDIKDISYKGIGVEDIVKVEALIPLAKKTAAALPEAGKAKAAPVPAPKK